MYSHLLHMNTWNSGFIKNSTVVMFGKITVTIFDWFCVWQTLLKVSTCVRERTQSWEINSYHASTILMIGWNGKKTENIHLIRFISEIIKSLLLRIESFLNFIGVMCWLHLFIFIICGFCILPEFFRMFSCTFKIYGKNVKKQY